MREAFCQAFGSAAFKTTNFVQSLLQDGRFQRVRIGDSNTRCPNRPEAWKFHRCRVAISCARVLRNALASEMACGLSGNMRKHAVEAFGRLLQRRARFYWNRMPTPASARHFHQIATRCKVCKQASLQVVYKDCTYICSKYFFIVHLQI